MRRLGAADRMLVKDQNFTDERIVLDGARYERCHFTRCKLVYQGYAETSLCDNTMEDCEFALEGAAALTMRFLVGLADSSDTFLVTLLRSLRLNPGRLDRLVVGAN